MISDFVKGRNRYNYPISIQQGIELHRAIDRYTDQHHATQLAKQIFKPYYRLYAAPLVDVVFDYYVAHTAFRTEYDLFHFSQRTYAQLDSTAGYFPPMFNTMFFYMKKQNWLYAYSQEEGIRKSLRGLMRRSRYLQPDDVAFKLFLSHKEEFEDAFFQLWPELKAHAIDLIKTFGDN